MKRMPILAIPDLATADAFDRIRVRPNPDDPRLTVNLTGTDHTGALVETRVPVERSLTLFLNGQEIVTAMTIGDYPEDLAVGYFLNQGMLRPEDVITGIDYDEELAVVVTGASNKPLLLASRYTVAPEIGVSPLSRIPLPLLS